MTVFELFNTLIACSMKNNIVIFNSLYTVAPINQLIKQSAQTLHIQKLVVLQWPCVKDEGIADVWRYCQGQPALVARGKRSVHRPTFAVEADGGLLASGAC